MYKINLEFISNEEGIYTKEEETATNEYWVNIKYDRMIKRWATIICPYLSTTTCDCIKAENIRRGIMNDKNTDKFLNNELLKFINFELERTNKLYNENRSFKITITEI